MTETKKGIRERARERLETIIKTLEADIMRLKAENPDTLTGGVYIDRTTGVNGKKRYKTFTVRLELMLNDGEAK